MEGGGGGYWHLQAFLENQLTSALTLQSAAEYRHWLLIYARFLVNEGSENRLRELCKELLGPVHKSAATAWEPSTLVEKVVPSTQPFMSLGL
ncbi:hira [Pungitius sinensis]